VIKVYWLAAGVSQKRVSGVLLVSFPAVGVPSAKAPANRMQATVPEEMSQTLLTNKKQGKNYQVHATHIIKPS
jgi:hypothetical protein